MALVFANLPVALAKSLPWRGLINATGSSAAYHLATKRSPEQCYKTSH